MPTLALRIFTLSAFILGLLLCGNGQAHADEPEGAIKVGVTVSAVINADAELGQRVSDALGKALGSSLSAEILAGASAQARLPDEARSETCLGESSCLVNAGKALGVDQLLMLIVVGVGDELKIEATWVDVASGETALRPGITTGTTDDAMNAAFSARAQELLPGIAPKSAVTATTSTTSTPTPQTNGASSTNLVASTPTTKKSSNALAIGLTAGGAVLLAGWGAYGINKLGTCEDFTCQEKDASKGRDVAVDIIAGGIGTAAFATGLYMLLTNDSSSEGQPTPSPVGMHVGSQSVGFTYGGSF